jgi:2-iminobutanoate/2-iminopropanoate deaminase
MSQIERLNPPGLPAPRGPYSPAIRAGDFIFLSGQVPVNPQTQQMELSGIRGETRLVLTNIQSLLSAAGATLADVVKCSVFLSDASDFAAMNEVYAEFFGDARPTRSTIVCQFAMPDMSVEIDCIAYRPKV